MHPSRLSLMTSFLVAAMARLGLKLPHLNREPIEDAPSILAGINKYQPHQGKRECARRRGGSSWIAYRNADRQRRGLPVVAPAAPEVAVYVGGQYAGHGRMLGADFGAAP